MKILVLNATLLLLIPWTSAQATQCAPDGSTQLRFVAQLNVSGCALFVHDTGASDGPHLAVQPIMCVTESLHEVAPQFDPVTQMTYVSLPVMVKDDAMLAEVQRQLRHLSPKSVKFATVADISVSSDKSTKFQALGFIWTVGETVGSIRLGCRSGDICSDCNLVSSLKKSLIDALDQVTLLVKIISNDSVQQLNYRLTVQNRSFIDPNFETARFACLPDCQQLRFVRSVALDNCTARVHQRLDMNGSFLIEPLLCYNITSMSNESVRYDYSRDMLYLKLDVVLQDDATMDAVRTQLADLSPRSVAFMRLWRTQRHVSPALSRRFEIGPLMMSVDGRSAQLRVYCRNDTNCTDLRFAASNKPVDLWIHIKFFLTSLTPDRCVVKSDFPMYPWRIERSGSSQTHPICSRSDVGTQRRSVVIQQRKNGSVSFQRTWADYEKGFGDETNFWIGLSTIHSLSMNGATLRVEMKLWHGSASLEYAGFKVEDASTNYRMTYREMLKGRSSDNVDALEHHRGMPFSTMDRDNDGLPGSYSVTHGGKAGWWFKSFPYTNPNGIYPTTDENNLGPDYNRYCTWWFGGSLFAIREVKLTLLI